MADGVDYYRFRTAGVGDTSDFVSVSFNTAGGDINLYVYNQQQVLVGYAANNNYRGNQSPETVSLASFPEGVYYIRVQPNATGGTLADYTLTITPGRDRRRSVRGE
ncbi:MAG: PPC domain-containing protein [Isosphaeraceae bacterium]